MDSEKDLIDHLGRSYTNGQEVIRFIDSKNGAITGLAVVLLGGSLTVAHFFLSATPPYFKFFPASICSVGTIAGLALMFSFIAFAACVFFSARSMLARPPFLRATVLFPYGNADAFELARTTLLKKSVLESAADEYFVQLQILASILSQKLPNSRHATWALIWQLGFTVVFAIVGLFFSGRI
jgi:hypothetical protein